MCVGARQQIEFVSMLCAVCHFMSRRLLNSRALNCVKRTTAIIATAESSVGNDADYRVGDTGADVGNAGALHDA